MSRHLVLALTVVLVACSLATAAPLNVYILAGQSNMWGQGRWSELTTSERELPVEVPYYRPYREGGFGFVRPIAGQFGPEISFSVQMQQRSSVPFAIVKHAIGSTTLAVDWHAHTGPLYEQLVEAVETAVATWSSDGWQPRIAGMAWMQGEHDAKTNSYASQYGANLAEFITSLRDDLGAPAMPFVLGRINVPNHPYREPVRTAQFAASSLNGWTYAIDTDSISLKDDMVHYNSQGLLELGRQFALAFPSPVTGDTNNDAVVDIEDLNNVRHNFGGMGLGDTNNDSTIDIVDLNNVRNFFGVTAPQAVPEPSSLALLAITLAGVVASRCRL